MPISRRLLLQSAALSFALGGRVAFAVGDRPASMPEAAMLIVIFLRGGCDGLSMLAPVNDPNYVADRAPELRVLDSGPKAGRRLAQTLAPALDFRLHPEAAPLGELYDARHLALLHAVGLTNGTRSHFVAQDLMERGIDDVQHAPPDGWLTRLLASEAGGAPAIATMPAIPTSLAYHAESLAIPDLRGGLGLPGGPQAARALADLYASGRDPFSRAAATTLAEISGIDARLPRGPDGKLAEYQPENGVLYEETESGRALRTVARLIKMDIGLKIAAVDIGGWDHHDNLAGRFSSLAGQFARGLAAFWNDVAAHHDRLTVVVMSEFGRRLRTNRSNGADHGHGGVMMVLGGHIAGGDIHGRWPGLASEELDNGVDLAVTTDYRAVLYEILATRMAARVSLPHIFPGFTPAQHPGVVSV